MTRVLVVEDEPLVRDVIVSELEDAGYDVAQAANGREAMAALEASDPRVDLLFTDIRLPGLLDGWAIAERARALNPDVKVVYATGYSADKPRQVPNSRFLMKPYRPQAVLDTFAELGV